MFGLLDEQDMALAGPVMRPRPLHILIINDGKPRHVNQSLGLAEALQRAVPAEINMLPVLPLWRGGLAWLTRNAPAAGLPAPTSSGLVSFRMERRLSTRKAGSDRPSRVWRRRSMSRAS